MYRTQLQILLEAQMRTPHIKILMDLDENILDSVISNIDTVLAFSDVLIPLISKVCTKRKEFSQQDKEAFLSLFEELIQVKSKRTLQKMKIN